jgi:hypothetical protein
MKHDLAQLPICAPQGAAGLLIAGCGLAFALTAGLPAHALVPGITESVTGHATGKQIEAMFEPNAAAPGQAIKQPAPLGALLSYDNMYEALRQQQIDLVFIPPAHVAFKATKTRGDNAAAWTAGLTEYKVSFLCKDTQPIGNGPGIAGKNRWRTSGTPDTTLTCTVRDTLLGLSQSDAGNQALVVSSYSAFVPASTEAEKALTVRVGL